MTWMEFLTAHRADLLWRSGEHVALCAFTLAAAGLFALPAGVWLAGKPRMAGSVLGLCSLVQTIPSLALLGFLLVLTGRIGWMPSVIALFLYALLPILRNTIVGLGTTPAPVRQAATALGMTPDQVLWQVSLPLALPVIFAGLRTAAVWTIGTATLCAFIGAGGLGVLINRGIETVDARMVLLGVVPAACLALIVDGLFAWCSRRLAHLGGS